MKTRPPMWLWLVPVGLVLMQVTVLSAYTGGVTLPPGQKAFANKATLVYGDSGETSLVTSPDRKFGSYISSQLPDNDRGQWWIGVYVDPDDPECKMLLRDFDEHDGLQALKAWAKFVVVPNDTPANRERHKEIVKNAGLPVIRVYADPEHPRFGKKGQVGWQVAYERSGYGGDAGLLGRDIYSGIVKLYEQCPGPGPCPYPGPDNDGYRPPDYDTPPLDYPHDPSVRTWREWADENQLLVLGIGLGVAWVIWNNRAAILARLQGKAAILIATTLLLGTSAAAQDATPEGQPAAEEARAPDHTPSVEDAYILPPAPRDWLWLDEAVRDQVRRTLTSETMQARLERACEDACEGILLDNLIRIENTAIAAGRDVEDANTALGWLQVSVLANLILTGLLYFRLLQPEGDK